MKWRNCKQKPRPAWIKHKKVKNTLKKMQIKLKKKIKANKRERHKSKKYKKEKE